MVYRERIGNISMKKKHLITLSDRQEIILSDLSKELGISLSELIRRGLDVYMEMLRDRAPGTWPRNYEKSDSTAVYGA
jgi:hypothetical protein